MVELHSCYKQLVEGCNTIYQSNGLLKKIFEEEKQILAWARESVVTEKDLLKGDELNINNIWVKRPAPINGVIAPRDYKKIMGRKVNKNIKKDTQLKWVPLYSMVSFTNTPYSEAWKVGMKQEKLMQSIMSTPNIEQIWESDEIMERMCSLV